MKRLALLSLLAGLIALGAAAPAGAITLKQNSSNVVEEDNSAACIENDGTPAQRNTYENSYYRLYDLRSLDAPSLTISSVTFGIEDARAGSPGGQPIDVYIHALTGSFTVPHLIELAHQEVTVADSESGRLRTVPISATITDLAYTQLVIEVYQANGIPNGHKFIIGSNSAPESAASYFRAPVCGADIPSETALWGFPDMSLVLFAEGTYPGEGGAPAPAPRKPCKKRGKGKKKGKRSGKAKSAKKKKKKKKCRKARKKRRGRN